MANGLDRPTSFAEGAARKKMDVVGEESLLKKYMQGGQDLFQSVYNAATQETEDKKFWGKAASIGTTLACSLITSGNVMACAGLGTAVGAGARMYVDKKGKAEDMLADLEAYKADAPEVKYLSGAASEIQNEFSGYIEDLESFHENEWKQDVMLQLGDTMTAFQMGSTAQKLGAFGSSSTAVPETSTTVVGDFSDVPMHWDYDEDELFTGGAPEEMNWLQQFELPESDG